MGTVRSIKNSDEEEPAWCPHRLSLYKWLGNQREIKYDCINQTSQINVHKGLFLLMSQALDELLYFLWNTLTLQENLRPSLPLASGHSSLTQTTQRLSSIKGLLWLKNQKAKNIMRGEM